MSGRSGAISRRCVRVGHDGGSRRVLLAIVVVCALVVPGDVSATEPSAAATSAERSDLTSVAKDHYAAGRYLEAARAFEMIWRETHRPGALFNAGMAREAAGQGNDALAIHHWRRYLALAGASTSAAERADIERKIKAAEQRTVAVELAYPARPGEPAPVQLDLRRGEGGDALVVEWPRGRESHGLHLDGGEWVVVVAGERGALTTRRFMVAHGQEVPLRVALVDPIREGVVDVRFGPQRALARGIEVAWQGPVGAEVPYARTVDEADARWSLSEGRWVLRARAPGFAPRAVAVDVGDEEAAVEVRLRRDAETRARIGVATVSGAAAIGMLAGGAVLFINRNSALSPVFADTSKPREEFPPELAVIRGASAGAVLLGAGGGATIAAVTAAGSRRGRALAAEAVVGTAALAAGVTWLQVHKDRCFRGIQTTEELKSCYHEGIPPAAMVGFGAGLLGASALALVTRAAVRSSTRRRAARLDAGGGPDGAYFSLRGEF